MKRFLYLAPVALFMILCAAFVIGLRHDPSKLQSVLIDQPLPAFDLPTVRGDGGLKTADFHGKPMLLNVFASWCVACRLEHDLLLQLKILNVPVQGLDWKDGPEEAQKYLTDNGDPYTKVGNDRSGRTGIDLGVTGVPETFIVDGTGRVRYKFIGPIEADDWKNTIKPLMDRLAAESKSQS